MTVGATVGDAFLMMFNLQRACEIQLLAQSGGAALTSVDARILAGVKQNLAVVTKGLGGNIAWPALLRRMRKHDPSFES